MRAFRKYMEQERAIIMFQDILKRLDILEEAVIKRRKWTYNKDSHYWECPYCHGEEIRTTDFCPNCGADMRGEE